MKKRLLSALLALALVFVLLPTTALAGETTGSDYDISINGTNYVFSDSETCYFKSSFTSTEPSSPYLKLTKNSNTITVTVSGYVTVSDINVHNNFSTQDKINLIITGNKGSTLNIECKDTYGAALETYQSGDITIKGGITVNANFSADNTDKYTDCYGIRASKNLIITGKGTTVNAVNADDAAAVKVDGNITVSDGAQLKATNKYSKKVTNYTGNAYAIECGGQLSISGDKTQVTADTSNGKKAISGTVNNGDKLTFKAANYKGSQIFLQRPMDEALGYKYVEITQAPTDPYVLINGQYAIIGQETPIPGGTGTYLYKKTTHDGSFLTLKGVDITGTSSGPARFIQFSKNGGYYTIQLEGENKISGFSSGIVAPEGPGVNDVTVVLSGSGSLDITANQYAIDMQVGKLKFENTGTIKLTTGYNYYVNPLNALRVKTGNISIDNTKYDIVGARQEKNYPTETISDSSAFTPDLLNGYTVGEETTLFKTITITPAAAKDSTIRYNGTTLKQGETIKDGKGGTATVATNGNTITLNNFKGTKALSFEATLADSTLVLEGTNTLSSIVTTQKGLTISGSGSLTVGSIRVTNNDNISADLTINGGAHVTVNRPSSEDEPAVEVSGNLTVTGDGTQLSAECTAATNPAIEVGGNASFTGSTVTITNNSDRQGKSGEYSYEVSTGLYVGGTLDIKNAAKVTSTVIGGNAIYAKGDITISGDSTEVNAQNSAYKFSAISTNGTVNISDNSTVKAENLKKHQGDPTGVTDPSTGKTYNACPAITGKIANKNSQNKLHIAGFTTSSAGSQNPTEGTPLYLDIAPGSVEPYIHHYYVTITRGDEVAHTESPIVIAGTTLLNDTYYTITDGSTVVANGSKGNYNAIYDSASKTLKLNNAQISHSFAHENGGGRDGAIIFKEFENYFIELSGENTISSTNTYAINCHRPDRTLTIKNAAEAENAKLTLTSNWMVICSIGGLNIQSDVTMVNTKEAGYLMYVNDTFSFDGYNAYASVNASGSPLVEYTVPTSGDKDAGYQYLRITKETLETGGGSTHQHVWDEAWHDTGDYHHAHQCTICKAYDTTTQELHNVTGHRDNHDGSHSNICGSCGYSAKVSHSYTWAPNANDNEKHIGTCVCGNVVEKNHNFVGDVCSDCGYDKSTGTTCEHVWTTEWTIDTVDNEYHWHKCIKCNAITDKKPHAYTIVTDSGTNHIRECECKVFYVEDHISSDWIIDAPATPTTAGSMHKECTVCKHKMQTEVIPATGEIVPPTPDNPGTIVIIRPAEEEKPAQQPNPSTGANDLVGLAVAAAVAAALGSAALLRKHD